MCQTAGYSFSILIPKGRLYFPTLTKSNASVYFGLFYASHFRLQHSPFSPDVFLSLVTNTQSPSENAQCNFQATKIHYQKYTILKKMLFFRVSET